MKFLVNDKVRIKPADEIAKIGQKCDYGFITPSGMIFPYADMHKCGSIITIKSCHISRDFPMGYYDCDEFPSIIFTDDILECVYTTINKEE